MCRQFRETMSNRRKVIQEFCRMFLCGELDSCRRIYNLDLQLLYNNPRTPGGIKDYIGDVGTPTDIKNYIEGVGTELFNTRPAKPAYVVTFLEFVLQTSRSANDISIDQFVIWTTNVLIETTFDPSSYACRSCINISTIFTSVVSIYALFNLIKMFA